MSSGGFRYLVAVYDTEIREKSRPWYMIKMYIIYGGRNDSQRYDSTVFVALTQNTERHNGPGVKADRELEKEHRIYIIS